MNPSPTSSQPSPRAFCQATGFVFQSAGFVLAMGTCCWWSFGGLAESAVRPTDDGRVVVELARDTTAAQRWRLAAVCVNFVGGLGTVALGIGLQYDRLRRGGIAMAMTGAFALFHAAYFVAAMLKFPSTAAFILTGVMTLLWGAMFLLAGVSAEQLKRHPPIRQVEVLTSRDEDDLRRSVSPRSPDRTNR